MIRYSILIAAASLGLLPVSGATAAECHSRLVKDGAKVIGTIEGPFSFDLWQQQGELLIKIPFEPKGNDYVPTGFSVTPFDLARFAGEYQITGRRGKPLRRGNANGIAVLQFSSWDLDNYGGNWVNVTLDRDGTTSQARFQIPSSYTYADQLAKLKSAWTAYRQSGLELCAAKGNPE